MPLAAGLARSSGRSNQAQMMAMRDSFSSGPACSTPSAHSEIAALDITILLCYCIGAY